MASLILKYDFSVNPSQMTQGLSVTNGNVLVDWGDGSSPEVWSAGPGTTQIFGHTYGTVQQYIVEVSLNSGIGVDNLDISSINNGSDNLVECVQFPDFAIGVKFDYAVNLVQVPNNIPSTLTNCGRMFHNCTSLNSVNVVGWDTSNIINMYFMFANTPLNQDIGGWDVSAVTDMRYLFFGATTFDQDISDWDISNVTSMYKMFEGAHTIRTSYYDLMLTKWASLPVNGYVDFHAGASSWTCDSDADTARNYLLGAVLNWTITDGACSKTGDDYYTNITDGVATGAGTEVSPFNYDQLNMYLEFNATNSDVFYIKGHKVLPDTQPMLFPRAFSTWTQTGPVNNVSFRGWDIETNGCPIIKWTYTLDFYTPDIGQTYTNSCGKNTWWNWQIGAASLIVPTFQDIIIQSDAYFVGKTGGSPITYKNVLIITPTFYTGIGDQYIGSQSHTGTYYGCTFNCTTMYGMGLTSLTIKDSVFDCGSITYSETGLDTLYAGVVINLTVSDTITNTDNIDTSAIVDISNYTAPIKIDGLASTPYIADFNSFIGYYTNIDTMYYKNFNVPTYETLPIQELRQTFAYNNGMFNNVRRSVGAYSFDGEFVGSDVPTNKGHIGSFYFGGDYANADIENVGAELVLDVPEGLDTYSAQGNIGEVFAVLNLDIPDVGATGVQSFSFDFSAAPTSGGSPLCTEFHAYNLLPNGSYESLVPTYLYWYPDYGENPTDVVKIKFNRELYDTDGIQKFHHTYCGGYLQEYDVRMCVDYKIRD